MLSKKQYLGRLAPRGREPSLAFEETCVRAREVTKNFFKVCLSNKKKFPDIYEPDSEEENLPPEDNLVAGFVALAGIH